MGRVEIFFIAICVFYQSTNGAVSGSLRRYQLLQQWREENKTRNITSKPSLRGFINLFSMIECATDCNPWHLRSYGNYCGLGGSGKPINDIDSCCEQHDACYDDNRDLYGCSSGMYVSSYLWSCADGYPACHDGRDQCDLWTCVCDKAMMECLQDAGCP
ncbi:basic phospholipase A2 DE-1-like isoform X2 [Leguminivora glycinivorella]|uniref:basic phospholipase A2 DE-1-like isoform X2 n=1 Tax=Leguminivora glycinivorella TaxID=1035111 RepID=UPI00200E9449|nr:basic phospholipase A2 DE-1-like isoform X2 [Leguminivora glycinivorella]